MAGHFEERAVGFLDVLGFKQLINEAEASPAGLDKLIGLRGVLDDHVLRDNDGIAKTVPDELKPKYIFVSDSIILSVPLHHSHSNLADGLEIVALKAIQVAQKIIELGHLVRGGISIGNVWHDDRNIFGTGFVDAYQTEQRAAHPRVLLSSEATNVWQKPSGVRGKLCIADGGDLILDIFHTYYLRHTRQDLPYEGYFQAFRDRMLANLQTMPLGSPERSKWEWMVGFFNDALIRHSITVPPLQALPIPL